MAQKPSASKLGSSLFTEEEAVAYLRLPEMGVTNPKAAMAYYRQKRGLKAVRFGKRCLYMRDELDRFASSMQRTGPEYGRKGDGKCR